MVDDSQRARLMELTDLLDRRGRSGAAGLSLGQAERLAELYRLCASDLVRAQRAAPQAQQTLDLELVMNNAYSVVYTVAGARYQRTVWRFLAEEFPQLVRREARMVGTAALLLVIGALAGAAIMAFDSAAAGLVIPDMHQEQTPEERIYGEQYGAFRPGESAVFSSFLFTHNIQVTFLVFALGLTFGIGTAVVLLLNGVPLGALAVQYFASGHGLFFLAWILPHGVMELTVVCISGAAGLVLARGLIRPGAHTRARALREQARTAVRLVLGGMPMLVVAGFVEGTVSQLHPPQLPYYTKLSVAFAMALACFWYLARVGKERARSGVLARTSG